MKVDNHEPLDIEQLIQQSVDAIRGPLNDAGYADYLWTMWNGVTEQVERKQVGEILGNMNRVEEQLRSEHQAHPDAVLWLLVEGILEPGFVNGKEGVWSMQKKLSRSNKQGRSPEEHLVPVHFYRTRILKYEGWLTSLERVGLRVRRTNDYINTAMVLVQMEKSAQRPHSVLQRHNKLQIKFHPDPQVMTLLGAYKSNIGPSLAERLVGKAGTFPTVRELMNASPELIAELVPGMGVVSAQKMLDSFGRRD
jgi:ERCC4-type nuclease